MVQGVSNNQVPRYVASKVVGMALGLQMIKILVIVLQEKEERAAST